MRFLRAIALAGLAWVSQDFQTAYQLVYFLNQLPAERQVEAKVAVRGGSASPYILIYRVERTGKKRPGGEMVP